MVSAAQRATLAAERAEALVEQLTTHSQRLSETPSTSTHTHATTTSRPLPGVRKLKQLNPKQAKELLFVTQAANTPLILYLSHEVAEHLVDLGANRSDDTTMRAMLEKYVQDHEEFKRKNPLLEVEKLKWTNNTDPITATINFFTKVKQAVRGIGMEGDILLRKKIDETVVQKIPDALHFHKPRLDGERGL